MGHLSKILVICAAAACTSAAAILVHHYVKRSKWQASVQRFLGEVQESFSTSKDRLLEIADVMKTEMVNGLKPPGTCLRMLPSYVDNLPNGAERGVFYALDLGGTNFRVMRVLLKGKEGRVGKTEYQGGVITPELMRSTKEALFDMMAAKLAAFVATEDEDFKPAGDHHRELGFTFSFPCEQTAINSGKLIRWTKGFSIPDTEGQDVVRVLEEAMQRQGLDMKVTALVNDAVGTLAGARYYDSDVVVAVILGTGSNACYEEREDTSFRLVGPPPASGHMVINIEWGNFNSPLLPVTAYDAQVDKNSPNPGEQQLEKLVSGMYLGEIARLVLVDLQQEVGIFDGSVTKIFEQYSLSTPNASKIHGDETPYLNTVGSILQKSFDVSTTYYQRKVVKDIVAMVASRGARLVSACMLGVLKKAGRDSGDKRSVIAVDGGLYENYTQYRGTLVETLNDLLGKEASQNVSMVLSKDGSGIGAALLAASHSAYTWKRTPSGSVTAL